MTHMPGVPIPGELGNAQPTDCHCRKCDALTVTVEQWDSSCGGYTDYKYTCATCGHSWWVDGPDS